MHFRQERDPFNHSPSVSHNPCQAWLLTVFSIIAAIHDQKNRSASWKWRIVRDSIYRTSKDPDKIF